MIVNKGIFIVVSMTTIGPSPGWRYPSNICRDGGRLPHRMIGSDQKSGQDAYSPGPPDDINMIVNQGIFMVVSMTTVGPSPGRRYPSSTCFDKGRLPYIRSRSVSTTEKKRDELPQKTVPPKALLLSSTTTPSVLTSPYHSLWPLPLEISSIESSLTLSNSVEQ